MDNDTRIPLEGMTLPSGAVLERWTDDLGIIHTDIPKEHMAEYGREVFRLGNLAAASFKAEHVERLKTFVRHF